MKLPIGLHNGTKTALTAHHTVEFQMPGLASGVSERTGTMMSAALQSTLTPTPHLTVLHQQRLYIVSALQRTHVVLDGVRARLNTIENTLAENKRHCSTTDTTISSQLDSPDTSSRTSSSNLPSEPSNTPPESPASHTADDQPDDDTAAPNQEEQARLSRATKKKLQHSRWRARSTLRNCVAEERALLENLHTIQDRILRLQDDALRDSTFAAPAPVGMTQTEFCNAPWMSGWTVEFGEKTAQLGCGFGPSDVPRKTSFGAPPGGAIRGSIDASLKQASFLNANTWMNSSGVSQIGNTAPIINAQLIPLTHPQLQVNTSCNQSQFPAQFQAQYPQPFIYSPAITSPLLLDPETTAEDLYDWQNGDASGNPYGCVDPSSVYYNVDPYHSFSYSSSGSFSYTITQIPQENSDPDSHTTQDATATNDPSADAQASCLSPFPEEWDLASALRAGRSGGASTDDKDNGTSTPRHRRRHVRQLSALLSPRGSRVYHIDDLLPPSSPGGPGPQSRKPSAVVVQADGPHDMGFGGWLPQGHEAKGKGKALDPTSPTFVPGAAFFAFGAPSGDVAMGERHPSRPAEEMVVVTAPVETNSSVSSNGTVDSATGSSPPGSVGGGAEKRRYSGYSAAAVDLLLNRFKENAANPIKKRRNWKRGAKGKQQQGGAGAGVEGLGIMTRVGENAVGEVKQQQVMQAA